MKRKLPADAELLELFESMTCKQIATRYGVHPSTVHDTIRAARRRASNPETINRKLPESAELCALAQKLSAQEIATRYGATFNHTQRAIRSAYVELDLEPPNLNRKLPSNAELLELSKTMTNAEIANLYGAKAKSVAVRLSNARRASGSKPKRQRRRARSKLPPADELLELSKTMLQREIADLYGVSPSYVSDELRHLRRAAGMPPMRRGRPPESKSLTDYDGPEPVELTDALTRWGISGTAEEYDVDDAQVAAWMRALDI